MIALAVGKQLKDGDGLLPDIALPPPRRPLVIIPSVGAFELVNDARSVWRNFGEKGVGIGLKEGIAVACADLVLVKITFAKLGDKDFPNP